MKDFYCDYKDLTKTWHTLGGAGSTFWYKSHGYQGTVVIKDLFLFKLNWKADSLRTMWRDWDGWLPRSESWFEIYFDRAELSCDLK